MKNGNICKFVTLKTDGRLFITNFVRETQDDVSKFPRKLTENIAILFLNGSGKLNFDDRRYDGERGSLTFGFEGETFCVENAENAEYLYVCFGGGRAHELLRRFGINRISRRVTHMEGIIPFWSESLIRAQEENVDLVCESVLLYTFSRLTAYAKSRDDVISRLMTLVEENFTDSSLSLTQIANAWSYNEKYLSLGFKKRTGTRFSDYLRSLRLKRAISLMDGGISSVKNVAYLSGFSDALYFSRVFKKETGVTPKAYVARKFI